MQTGKIETQALKENTVICVLCNPRSYTEILRTMKEVQQRRDDVMMWICSVSLDVEKQVT